MTKEFATLAGGCFWGVEELFSKLDGVVSSRVGYTGGIIENPTYDLVRLGTTGHAEAIQIEFLPEKISFEKILEYFFRLHDPTTLNQQGNDKGTQYRSAIFYHSDAQKKNAEDIKEKLTVSKKWEKPIVTEIVPFVKFYLAEEYHQKYLKKNPNGYNCHYLRK